MTGTPPPKRGWKETLFPLRPWYRNLWFSDFRTAMIFFAFLFMMIGFYSMTGQYHDIAENPCSYCQSCNAPTYYVGGGAPDIQPRLNLTINLEEPNR